MENKHGYQRHTEIGLETHFVQSKTAGGGQAKP